MQPEALRRVVVGSTYFVGIRGVSYLCVCNYDLIYATTITYKLIAYVKFYSVGIFTFLVTCAEWVNRNENLRTSPVSPCSPFEYDRERVMLAVSKDRPKVTGIAFDIQHCKNMRTFPITLFPSGITSSVTNACSK